jgi:hypothetical protein
MFNPQSWSELIRNSASKYFGLFRVLDRFGSVATSSIHPVIQASQLRRSGGVSITFWCLTISCSSTGVGQASGGQGQFSGGSGTSTLVWAARRLHMGGLQSSEASFPARTQAGDQNPGNVSTPTWPGRQTIRSLLAERAVRRSSRPTKRNARVTGPEWIDK